MKKLFIIFVILSSISFAQQKWAVVIHGGAGNLPKDMPDSTKTKYLSALEEALKIGTDIVKNNGNAIDAVEKVINYLEDNILFNAGKGAVFTKEGTHELDASIMDGRDLSTGAVAIVKHIKNPISLARLVKEKTPHVLFAGEGAEIFAKEQGVTLVEQDYFHTPETFEKWKKSSKDLETSKKGTVGCVVLDMNGNLAAGTSTGGRQNKMIGRIGDSPLVNAGTYANNKSCGVSCTGDGELFIKNTIAYNMSAFMLYRNMNLSQAADELINKTLESGTGGLIAIDKSGNISVMFNTTGMYHAYSNSSGDFKAGIWDKK